MKPSGIEWIGDIPDDWEVRKLLSLFKEHKDRNKNLEEQNLLSLSYGKIKRKDINNNDGLLPASFETYNIVENGDIVFRLTDLQNDKRSLRTGIVTQRGIITSAYVTIRPKIRLDSRFFHYLYHMYDICKVFYGMGDGVRQGMGFEDLKNIPTLIPPLKTQQKIADYLDKKCGEIDATIAKQKESIEKLKAYKQSLISETVTKGLDKSAPLKPSGIKWIGDIPDDWEVRRLKGLGEQTIGLTYSPQDITDNLGTLVLRSSNIQNGRLVLDRDDNVYVSIDVENKILKDEDILICSRNGSRNLVGKTAFVITYGKKLSYGAFTTIFRSKYNRFLFYVFNAGVFEYHLASYNTSTINQLTTSMLNEIRVPLPPLKTQRKIADYLDSKCSQIDKYITEKQNIIQKLDAYKKSLIFECVTGKHKI